MALFSKQQSQGLGTPPSAVPIDDVMRMKQQGLTDSQITQALHVKGYSTQQAADALQQATVGAQPTPQAPTYQQPQFNQPPQQEPSYEGYSMGDERMEEIAEAIIDEKWQEMIKDVKKVIDWKEVVESKVDHLEQQIKDVRASMENMQKAIFGKISDYDKSITDVGTEIKAMEKVFQKVLPSLTESVNKLERLTKVKKS